MDVRVIEINLDTPAWVLYCDFCDKAIGAIHRNLNRVTITRDSHANRHKDS